MKMAYIEAWTEPAARIAARYDELLAAIGLRSRPLAPPTAATCTTSTPSATPRRDALQAFLTERGVGTNIHYPIPVHLQKAFAELGHGEGDFPHAEAAADEVLSLPMYPEFQPEQQDAGDRGVARLGVSSNSQPSRTK